MDTLSTIIIVIFLAIVWIHALWPYFETPYEMKEKYRERLEFTGEGNKTSGRFTIKGKKFRITYTTEKSLEAYLYNDKDEQVGKAMSMYVNHDVEPWRKQVNFGEGFEDGGEFYLTTKGVGKFVFLVEDYMSNEQYDAERGIDNDYHYEEGYED